MPEVVLLSELNRFLELVHTLTYDSLIAYKIISLKPLRVEESAVGTGGLCGSAFLNYRFEEHVRGRLGQTRFDEMKTKKGKTWQMGLRYFEEFVKRNFNEDEHQEVNVPYVYLIILVLISLTCLVSLVFLTTKKLGWTQVSWS